MTARTYKIPKPIPVLGAFGLLFWTYVLLYCVHVVPWAMFGNAAALNLEGRGLVVLLIIGPLPCVAAIATLRLKAGLTAEGMYYRGFVRQVCIPWEKVTSIHLPGRGFSFTIHADGHRRELLYLVRRHCELKDDIALYARKYGPHITVTEGKARRCSVRLTNRKPH